MNDLFINKKVKSYILTVIKNYDSFITFCDNEEGLSIISSSLLFI